MGKATVNNTDNGGTWLWLRRWRHATVLLGRHVRHRFGEEQCLRIAAALSYSSLLAVVPLLAVMLAIMSAFPAVRDVEQQVEAYLFANLVPESSAAVTETLRSFVRNASGLTAPGTAALMGVAIILFSTIEQSLNRIFRSRRSRGWLSRVLVFWALLTMTPLLIGLSLSLKHQVLAFSDQAGLSALLLPLTTSIQAAVPVLFTILALFLVYMLVPNRPVALHDALVGAVLAGVVFSLLRAGFGLYVEVFPGFRAIYGTMAVIPLFLVWMYLSWAVILGGAVITSVLPNWRAGLPPGGGGRRGVRLPYRGALTVLYHLHRAQMHGAVLSRQRLGSDSGLPGPVVDSLLEALTRGGLVGRMEDEGWTLRRSAASTSAYDVLHCLGMDLESEIGPGRQDTAVDRLLSRAASAEKKSLDAPLLEIWQTLEAENALRLRLPDGGAAATTRSPS